MLTVEAIRNGIVIDHITTGKGMDIYQLLHLEACRHSVALLQSVKSKKYGTKDLIKVETTEPLDRLDILGYLDKRITLVLIQDGNVVNKYHPTPPSVLKNVIPCRNPRCISSIEAGCDHISLLSPGGKYRCVYCGQEISVRSCL